MGKIKAVLFDIDGTLIDTWDFVFGAFQHTLKIHGHSTPTEEVIKSIMGRPLIDFYKTAFPNLKDVSKMASTHHSYQKDKFDIGKPFPKAVETLEKLRSRRFLIAAISNRTKKSLHKSLKMAKIHQYFDLILSAEDVKNPKPHKEHPLTALKHFKVKAVDAFMVGDTNLDILAGKKAKIKTVGVTYGFSGENIKAANPDFVIDKIEDLLKILN